jgi:hypothetical protein
MTSWIGVCVGWWLPACVWTGVCTALCHPIGGKKTAYTVRCCAGGGAVGVRSVVERLRPFGGAYRTSTAQEGDVRSVVERLRPFGVVLDDLVALQRPTKHGAVFEDGRVRVGDVHNSVLE